jgi:hypothetical protein
MRGLLRFLWEEKRWWLAPILAVLVLLGLVLAFTDDSRLPPFIYHLGR